MKKTGGSVSGRFLWFDYYYCGFCGGTTLHVALQERPPGGVMVVCTFGRHLYNEPIPEGHMPFDKQLFGGAGSGSA